MEMRLYTGYTYYESYRFFKIICRSVVEKVMGVKHINFTVAHYIQATCLGQ
jgi:hypothetical protein